MALLIDSIRRIDTPTVYTGVGDEAETVSMREAALRQGRWLVEDCKQVWGKAVVRITNVAAWVAREYDHKPFVFESLECNIPPFSVTWLEWEGRGVPKEAGGRMGVLVHADREDTGEWLLLLQFVFIADERLAMPLHSLAFVLDEEGRISRHGFFNAAMQGCPPSEISEHERQEMYVYPAAIVLQAINFMNCTGVKEALEEPSKTPLQKKWNDKARKQGKKPMPLVSYTTLNIGPLFVPKRKAGGSGEPTGIHQRLHWTRGHVKHYPGLMLFGRVKLDKPGIWCPAFRSGRAKEGVVHHEKYEVVPDRETMGLGAAAGSDQCQTVRASATVSTTCWREQTPTVPAPSPRP